MSEIYGAEHLLRLFGKYLSASKDYESLIGRQSISDLLSRTPTLTPNPSTFFEIILMTSCSEWPLGLEIGKPNRAWYRWMIKEQKRLFMKEYEETTTHYQNLSRS